MNEAMKLTEEPEPTAFLKTSRTMISKGKKHSNSKINPKWATVIGIELKRDWVVSLFIYIL